MRHLTKPNLVIASTTLLWAIGVALGLRMLLTYENTPGATGEAPSTWPTASKLHLEPKGKTLLMFAHPRCPCTVASVEELAQIMAHCQGQLHAYVLLWKPGDASADWEKTKLSADAAHIPGVTVLSDAQGGEAQRFGAATSGDVLLFDSSGRRLFHGGITGSRGHAGDNAGAEAVVAFVRGAARTPSSSLVFGCSLSGRPKTRGPGS